MIRRIFHQFDMSLAAIERWMNIASVGLIMVLMLSAVSDIGWRYVTGGSIGGVFELDELLMVGIVFLAIAYTQSQKGNIRMELLISRFQGKRLYTFEVICCLLSLFICAILFYRSLIDAYINVQIGEVTQGIVSWPRWPANVAVCAGFFFLSVRLCIQSFQYIKLLAAKETHSVS